MISNGNLLIPSAMAINFSVFTSETFCKRTSQRKFPIHQSPGIEYVEVTTGVLRKTGESLIVLLNFVSRLSKALAQIMLRTFGEQGVPLPLKKQLPDRWRVSMWF
jgi:hypothetical protein